MTRSTEPSKSSLGKVYLVGAGPGAADLITVRGAKLLAQADIVFHDALVEPEMLALCPRATLVPVGKRCGKLSSAQAFINKRLIDAAHQYQTIVRLKGGDPMLFGRADEEINALKQAGIAVEVVPGITAALAGAASIQQSLTLRGISRSVAFITLAQGTENIPTDHARQPIAVPSADTMVYYMGRKDAKAISQQLIAEHVTFDKTTPVQILEAVSTSRERHWRGTLTQMAQGDVDNWFESSSPALIVIGDAVKAASSLQGIDAEIDDGLQNSGALSHGRRIA
jgi:uroporphyrin-III C-methyltransferase